MNQSSHDTLGDPVPDLSGTSQTDAQPLASAPVGTPTPITISQRSRLWLLIAAFAILALLLWKAPSVPTMLLGGFALALVLSFPVRLLSKWMRRSFAITVSFLVALLLLVLLLAGLLPVLAEQLSALIDAAPGIAQKLDERVPSIVDALARRGLLPGSPDQFVDSVKDNALASLQGFARRMLGSLGNLVSGALSTIVAVFGMIFIAAYLLADSRAMQAQALKVTPIRYRHDMRELNAGFTETLSRYLGGLAISLAAQGAMSAIALFFLGVPYAALLGVWVAITALIPFMGAFLGAIPAVLLALTISPTTAVLTAVLFLLIQQLEGNVLTPRLQSQAVRVHPILVFLAAIAGGELAGVVGIVFAVPLLAVCRVLYDFFSARLHVVGRQHSV